MRKGIYKDERLGTWYINTKVKVGDDFKVVKIRGYSSKSEADHDYERAVNAWIKEHTPHCSVMFFKDLIAEERENRKLDVKLQTLRCDDTINNKYFSSWYSSLLSDVLTKVHIETWYRSFANRNDISTPRKNKVIIRLKTVLAYAYQHLYIDAPTYQICDVILKRIKTGIEVKDEKQIWTRDEYDRFIDAIPTDEIWYPLFLLMGELGCRIGELQGLMWKHFNAEDKTIYICQQVIEGTGQGKWIIDTPKTATSIRYDRLTDDMVEILSELKEIMGGKDNDFIFGGTKPISRNSIRRALYRLSTQAGVPIITPHGLRHSNTSWLISQVETVEDVKVVSKRLGHSDVSITLNTYAHILNSKESEMVGVLSRKHKALSLGEKKHKKCEITQNLA